MTIHEIGKKIGTESLGYISIEGLKEACKESRLPFCTGCFNKEYGEDINE